MESNRIWEDFPMRRRNFDTAVRFAVLTFVFGVMAALPGYAPAAPQTVEEIVNYMGADRQAVLEAGARKEGEALFYQVGTQSEPVIKRFREKYPYIDLKSYRADNTQLVRRVVEEYKAGRYLADLYGANTGGLVALREAGILQPFDSPELAHYRKDGIEANRNWAVYYLSYLSLGYNTKIAPEAASINTYDDLLDPKWKGKMYVSDWTSSSANWVGVLVLERGEDYVRRFAKQEIVAYAMSPRAVANLIVSGEAPISPITYSSHIASSKSEGASVAWKALGTTFSNPGGIGIMAKSPHPHATMLFVDFSLSLEGQKMNEDLGYSSARLDMPEGMTPKSAVDLSQRPNFLTEYEQWNRLASQVFGKGKEATGQK